MFRKDRTIVATGVCGVLVAVALTGCGGLKEDDVAKVGKKHLTKTEFADAAKLVSYASLGGSQLLGIKELADFKNFTITPPYKSCVDIYTKASPKAAKGQKQPTAEDFKKQCTSLYKQQVMPKTMAQLITPYMIDDAAKSAKVKVTDAEVDKAYNEIITQAIGGTKNKAKFETFTGLKVTDLKPIARQQLLTTKIQSKVVKDASDVKDADIEAFYKKNIKNFTTPETRNLRIILTKGEAKANEAKKKVEGGAKWSAVAKEFSKDESSKSNGGLLEGAIKGGQERALDTAVFDVPEVSDKTFGPIKTETGYYIFQVRKISKAVVSPLSKEKAAVKQQLVQKQQTDASEKWSKDLLAKWKANTECAAGYKMELCKGYKAPKTPSTPATPAG